MKYSSAALISFGATAFTLFVSEILLRAAGFVPFTRLPGYDHIPVMTEVDGELGWRNRPGTYRYSLTNDGDNMISVSVSPDGRRTAVDGSVPQDVWVFGCSFSFGWAVTDGLEYPAQLDTLLGRNEVANFSVPGFGTQQAYKMFQRQIAQNGGQFPKTVIYGFASFHDTRNVATEEWLRTLTRAGRSQAWVRVPKVYQTASGDIQVGPPESYPVFPFSSLSSVSHITQQAWANIELGGRDTNMHSLTVALIKQWADEVRAAGSNFIVMGLYLPRDLYFYRTALDSSQVTFVDGSYNGMPLPSSLVRGDGGHPIPSIHARWAHELFAKIKGDEVISDRSHWEVDNERLIKDNVELREQEGITGFIDTVSSDHGELKISGWAVDIINRRLPTHLVLVQSSQNNPFEAIAEVAHTQDERSDVLAALKLDADTSPPGFRLGVSLSRLRPKTKLRLVAATDNGYQEVPCKVTGCEILGGDY